MKNISARYRTKKKIPSPRLSVEFPLELHKILVEDLYHADLLGRWSSYKWSYSDITTFISECQALTEQCITSEEGIPVIGSAYLLGSIVRKFPFPSIGNDIRRNKALDAFKEAEKSCSQFNRRLWHRLDDKDGQKFLTLCREFIERTIGNVLPLWETLTSDARHGPGASIGNSGGKSNILSKYVNWPYTVTIDAFDYARLLVMSDQRWFGSLEDSYRRRFGIPMWSILNWDAFWHSVFKIVPGNRVTTVPKDCLKDRTIAIEPTINVMLQLGVDGVFRRRLRNWGINLDDQSKNCRLSRSGSISNLLATIDLSSASDTVSLRLCKLLLPEKWYRYLCAIRSPKGTLPGGKVLRYSKISSMGNGYTFALESLIFASIVYASAHTVGERWDVNRFAIYGDDLIMPQHVCVVCMEFLRLLGFIPNDQKSYLNGPFRESCGTDWYKGHHIRPVYLKEEPKTVCDLYALHNRLQYWAWDVLGDIHIIQRTLDFIKARLPVGYLLYGPYSMDDMSSYLHSTNINNHRKVVFRPRRFRTKEYLFLRLLNSLRPQPKRLYYPTISVSERMLRYKAWLRRLRVYNDDVLVSSLQVRTGSVYDITYRKVGKLVLVKGDTPFWGSSYLSRTDALAISQREGRA